MYFAFLGLTQFVQMPRDVAGYGFGATVLQVSVYFLVPGALTGFVLLALAHDQAWQVIVAGVLANAYISLGYGALPALVVSEVDAAQTGIATSMNAIARTVGSSVAAAIVAVLIGHARVPSEFSFVVIFTAGAVTAALAMALIAVSRTPDRHRQSVQTLSESRAKNHEWG